MTDVRQEFGDVLDHFETAMLVTKGSGAALRARPMAIAGRESNGDLWFSTSIDSPKVEELEKEAQVCATLQSSTRFLSISGRAQIVKDRQRVEQFWKPSWKVWFPKGKEDPSIVLVRLVASEAEYWDEHGAKGLSYLIEGARALLRGEKAKEQTDPKQHAKLSL
jgi:general stress protein 26